MNFPLVVIELRDHTSMDGWMTNEQTILDELKPLLVKSVGWLYRETAEGFILLGAISQENEHVAMGQFILKSATINKREIVQ